MPKKNAEESLQEKVARGIVIVEECWIWKGKPATIDGMSPIKAAYIAEVGEVPDDAVLVATCGTDGCVNPEHVSVSSGASNTNTNDGPSSDVNPEEQVTEEGKPKGKGKGKGKGKVEPADEKTPAPKAKAAKTVIPIDKKDITFATNAIKVATKAHGLDRAAIEKGLEKPSDAKLKKMDAEDRLKAVVAYSRKANVLARGTSRLSEDMVRHIRTMRQEGKPVKAIADLYHIAASTVADIVAHRMYKGVE